MEIQFSTPSSFFPIENLLQKIKKDNFLKKLQRSDPQAI